MGKIAQNIRHRGDSVMSLTGTLPKIFECPHCEDTIGLSARDCGVAADNPLVQQRAMILWKVKRACSDATYMRSCAMALPVFIILRFVPFFMWTGGVGFTALCIVIPAWAMIWWSRFSDLESEEPDYVKSRKSVRVAGVGMAVMLLLLVIAPLMARLF